MYEVPKVPLGKIPHISEEVDALYREAMQLFFIKKPWYKRIIPRKVFHWEMNYYGNEIWQGIIYILRNYPARIAHLLFYITNIPEEEILKGSLDDIYGLLKTVWEENDLIKIYVFATKKQQAQSKKT
jgi:hypothetical protein